MRRYISLSPSNLFVWVNLVLIKRTGLTVLIAAVSFHENKLCHQLCQASSHSPVHLRAIFSVCNLLFFSWSARQPDVTGQFDNTLGEKEEHTLNDSTWPVSGGHTVALLAPVPKSQSQTIPVNRENWGRGKCKAGESGCQSPLARLPWHLCSVSCSKGSGWGGVWPLVPDTCPLFLRARLSWGCGHRNRESRWNCWGKKKQTLSLT